MRVGRGLAVVSLLVLVATSGWGAAQTLADYQRFALEKTPDVRNDPRYLTALGNTLSEMIVPVLDSGGHKVIGTIDVESEFANAAG